MTPQQLTHELSSVTRKLLDESDLDQIEQLLVRRSSILKAITESDPHAFTPEDLAKLRTAALDATAAIERLTLLHRETAADWHRLTRLRDSTTEPSDAAISLVA